VRTYTITLTVCDDNPVTVESLRETLIPGCPHCTLTVECDAPVDDVCECDAVDYGGIHRYDCPLATAADL
jgi:hypothetical protein